MRPAASTFSWDNISISDGFSGITEKIIEIPAKKLGFPQIRSVPGKDAALARRTQFSTVFVVEMGKTWFLWCRCDFFFGVFFFFLVDKQVLLCFGGGRWRISRQLGSWISKNLTITKVPHGWGRTNFGPAHTTEPPGHIATSPWLST